MAEIPLNNKKQIKGTFFKKLSSIMELVYNKVTKKSKRYKQN